MNIRHLKISSLGATCIVFASAATLICTAVPAFERDGQLLIYPNGRNMNGMPASAIAIGVPLVLTTGDSVAAVDAWYRSNAPKTCTRSAESGGVKYSCPGGSIMIYAKNGTQIAFVPAMQRF